MSNLPRGWEWTRIGAVADIQLGRQRSPKNHNGLHMRPYLRSANVTWAGIDVADVKEMNFEPSEAATFELQPGDLVLNEASGSPNEVGKPAIWRGEIAGCCFQNTLLRVRSKGPITAYLYWYCRFAALGGEFGKAGRGVNIRHLGKQGLASFPLPLPPRADQERIVAAIEEHLSRLDAAETALSSGAARVGMLMRSASAAVFDPDWPTKSLSDACSVIVDCPHSTAKFVETGVACIDTTNIEPFVVNAARMRFVSEATYLERTKRHQPAPDDVIFAREGTVGTAVRVPPRMRLCLGQRVMLLRSGPGLRPDFLELAMNSPFLRRQYRPLILGTTAPHLNVRDVKCLQVPVPALGEQGQAVIAVHEARRSAGRVSVDLEVARGRALGLRRSLLAAAFSGRLVAREGDDETTSALLEPSRAKGAADAAGSAQIAGHSPALVRDRRPSCEDQPSLRTGGSRDR